MLSRHLLLCACRPGARTGQGSGPRSSPGWGQFVGLATHGQGLYVAKSAPPQSLAVRLWGPRTPLFSREMAGCDPRWGRGLPSSLGRPLLRVCCCPPVVTPILHVLHLDLPSADPRRPPEPRPHYSSGGPCPAGAQEEAAPLPSTVAQAADPLCPSGPIPLFMACLLCGSPGYLFSLLQPLHFGSLCSLNHCSSSSPL